MQNAWSLSLELIHFSELSLGSSSSSIFVTKLQHISRYNERLKILSSFVAWRLEPAEEILQDIIFFPPMNTFTMLSQLVSLGTMRAPRTVKKLVVFHPLVLNARTSKSLWSWWCFTWGYFIKLGKKGNVTKKHCSSNDVTFDIRLHITKA